jgi:hypothetical protein
VLNDEMEEFRIWRKMRRNQDPIDEAFEALERIMSNPFSRGYDSAFRVISTCLIELRKKMEQK